MGAVRRPGRVPARAGARRLRRRPSRDGRARERRRPDDDRARPPQRGGPLGPSVRRGAAPADLIPLSGPPRPLQPATGYDVRGGTSCSGGRPPGRHRWTARRSPDHRRRCRTRARSCTVPRTSAGPGAADQGLQRRWARDSFALDAVNGARRRLSSVIAQRSNTPSGFPSARGQPAMGTMLARIHVASVGSSS